MTDEARRDRRFEQDRRLNRGDLARADALHGALARAAADAVRRYEVERIARGLVPIIALHLVAFAGDERAPDAVPRVRITAEESERVSVDELRLLSRHGRAFGIADPAVDREAGVLGELRELD